MNKKKKSQDLLNSLLKKYIGQFIEYNSKFDKALKIWLEYYIILEEYDRMCFGGWSNHVPDLWIPFTPNYELYKIINKDVSQFLAENEIDKQTSKDAHDYASRMKYSSQIKMLADMEGKD